MAQMGAFGAYFKPAGLGADDIYLQCIVEALFTEKFGSFCNRSV
jgi:hypothetical protein